MHLRYYCHEHEVKQSQVCCHAHCTVELQPKNLRCHNYSEFYLVFHIHINRVRNMKWV